MPEIVQDWLATRLGLVLDTSPQNFGRNTKDGTIMAKLLSNFGVIPAHVSDKIKESKNFHECYNNWINLQPWLKHIGATHDNETLKSVAGGEGSSAFSLFYSVYLNLEGHDRLHYISAQRERRFSAVTCGEKFKVDVVPEAELRKAMGDSSSKLAEPFIEKHDLIQWHRAKCKEVIENINKTKKKFSEIMKKNQPKLGPIVSKFATSQPINQRLCEAEEMKGNINIFEKKHPEKYQDFTYSELIKQQHDLEQQPCFSVPNLPLAKKMIRDLKRRKKSEIYSKTFVQKMQMMVLDEEWKQISDKQYQNFEDMVCKNLLKQSQYEKQMTNKLYQLRQQKKILAENRSIIESLKMDQRDKEFNDRVALRSEYRGEYLEEEEFQREKFLELHKRIYANKVKARKEFIRRECRAILYSIADIVIKITEVREQTSCQIPKALMKDLKELFFKNLPIFDCLANLEELYENEESLSEIMEGEGEEGEQETISVDESYKLIKNRESYRQSMLDDCDFFDYQNLIGPWMVQLLFPDSGETEVNQIVLGYIVHKILGTKYPIPQLPSPAPIKSMRRAYIVQDLEDEACKMLTDLMELCKILVVYVEDAINFVLLAYKQEALTSSLVNETLVNISRDNIKKKESKKEVSKKLLLLKKEETRVVENNGVDMQDEFFYFSDKETQTPNKIPEDYCLSSNAEIGRKAFEALHVGDPVPDPTIICAIVAYITAKQNDYDGWVLINYPRLYTQASDLEFALSGCRVMPELKSSESLEEVEGFSYQNLVVNPFNLDELIKNRTSQLVPKFKKEVIPVLEVPTTFFNVFLKLKKLNGQSKMQSEETNNLSSMEQFYLDQKVFRVLKYATQNFQTVKNIGKIILGGFNELGEGSSETSLEIFGNDILELNEKWSKQTRKTPRRKEKDLKKAAKTSKQPELEKLENYSTFLSYGTLAPDLEVENISQTEENLVVEDKSKKESKGNSKPGDPDWAWAEGFQPEGLLLALATLWENMEAVYIEDLKDVFFALRVHRLNVLSYCSFVGKSRKALMRRKDDKQTILEEFQKKFNSIEEDVRIDVDVKTELYVRVAELEEILMGMADERKKNSFNDINVVANDKWVPNEMANLVNCFLTGVQLEVDRSVNTCQIINDYYLSLLQKIPEAKPIGKIFVPKLQTTKDKTYSIVSTLSAISKTSLAHPNSTAGETKRQNTIKSELESGTTSERVNKVRNLAEKRKKSLETNMLNGAAEAISEILMNLSFPNGATTPFHDFLKESVAIITKEIQSLISGYIETAQKGEKGALKTSKKDSDMKTVLGSINLEWATALENELARFLFRARLLLAKGIFDLNEFLTTILNTFSSLDEGVKEMYCKEIQSISDCCKVFRCGIEEEMPIQPQLVLKEDEFCINKDVWLYDKSFDHSQSIKREKQISSFTVDQLTLLFEKLQRVAPDGEIIKRSLLFIFEDLRALHYEIKSCNCFPEAWKLLEPEDMTFILNELYQDLEIVNWKDFIIYALDLPVPSEEDILTMRDSYRIYDSLTTELITWEHFNRVCFWFDSSFQLRQDNILDKVKELLFRMYQVDENRSNYSALLLAFCKDENPIYGFTKALALATGKKVRINEIKSEYSSLAEEYEIFEDEAFEESGKTTPKRPHCSLSPSVEMTLKCLPKEKILRCDCGDAQQSVKTEEEDNEKVTDNAGENGSVFYQDSLGYPYSALTVSVIPCNIISSVFKASFPSLPQLSVLLDCKETFQETLNSIYDSLDSKNGKIDVFDLIRHNFVSRLLLTTNKFKFIKIQRLFECALNAKKSMAQSSLGTSRINYSSFA